MEPTINTPYKGKRKESNGTPLVEPYFNEGPNRRQRREAYHNAGGSKVKLIVFPTGKYTTWVQKVREVIKKVKVLTWNSKKEQEVGINKPKRYRTIIQYGEVVNTINHAEIKGEPFKETPRRTSTKHLKHD